MRRRSAIEDYPRYGYALEVNGRIVGVILLIYSRNYSLDGSSIRCNISSWCVDVGYRGYAILLHLMAVNRKEVTYTNVSPAKHTRSAIGALGFKRFSNGQIFFIPILSKLNAAACVRAFEPESSGSALLSQTERQILADHAELGCLSLVCYEGEVAFPFVLQKRAIWHRLIPCSVVVYCRNRDEFARFAGSIGRYLLFSAGPFCAMDATGPMRELVGRYSPERNPKYYKGPVPPTVGDLSYTEGVIFGP
jgi:hypothetical protein